MSNATMLAVRGDVYVPCTGRAMRIPRRQLLRLGIGAAALPAVSCMAWAQVYPTRPVHLILGYAPGNAPDIVARLFGQWLSQRLGQQFVIENRPGAGSNIGAEAAIRSAPDGYSLLYATTANAINATLYAKLSFDFLRDTAPVGSTIRVPNLIAVNGASSITSLAGLIAYAKANPGRLNFGAPTGGTVLLTGALFNMMAGVNIVHVPYSNQMQAVTDLIADQVQVSFDAMPTTIEFARAGKLRPLAVTTAARSPALPDVPAVGEFVPGYEASSWHGICAPRGTPREIIDRLNREINAGLGDLALKERLAGLGGTVAPGTPADFGRFLAEETEKWAKVVKFAGIKPE
jgi:tripartite-type tricarboxylate transporter receptor subunit TctC